ncbi:hypothetical protein ACF0H5_009123 [Mactra antiquata]
MSSDSDTEGLFIPFAESSIISMIQPHEFGYTGYFATNYVFHTSGVSWNEAYEVCQDNGGNLAKIGSRTLHRMIHDIAYETYNYNIFDGEDYYISIARSSTGEFVWTSDCTSHSNVNETYIENPSKNCIRIHWDTLIPDDHDCHHAKAFLCEQPTNIPCEYNTLISSSNQFIPDTNETECAELCRVDVTCWSVIRFPVGMCVKLLLDGYGNDGLELLTKQCIKVTLNETSASGYTENGSNDPSINCSTIYNETSSLPLPPAPTVIPSPVLCNATQEQVTMTVSSTVPTTVVNISTVHTTITDVTTRLTSVTVTKTIIFNITTNLTEQEIIEEAEIKANEYRKNLSVNTKATSSYIRGLTSAQDSRTSANFVGYVGVLFVAFPFAVMILSDIRRLVMDFRYPRNMYALK